jgi:hypothetical protein
MNLKCKTAGCNPAVSEHIDASTFINCGDYSTLSSPYFLCAMIWGAAC